MKRDHKYEGFLVYFETSKARTEAAFYTECHRFDDAVTDAKRITETQGIRTFVLQQGAILWDSQDLAQDA
jgi:hypothetical protein